MTVHFLKLRKEANSTAKFKLINSRNTVNSTEANWTEAKKITIPHTTGQFLKTKYKDKYLNNIQR